MQKSGQLTSAIDFLIAQNKTDLPITRSLSSWFKQRRFIGSKDRRIIKKTIWGVVRNYGKISFLLNANQGINNNNAHLWISCYLILKENATMQTLEEDLYNNNKYGLPSISDEDKNILENLNLDSLKDSENSYVNFEVPKWVYNRLLDQQKIMDLKEIHALLTNLQEENSTYIHTNTWIVSKEELLQELAQEDITEIQQSNHVPNSIEILGNKQLTHLQSYKNGLFHMQDHNSQLITSLIPVKEHDVVMDYCAGAGGKSLTLSNMMNNKGTIFAHDLEDDRLKRLIPRLKREKARNIQVVFHDEFHKKVQTQADILLLDVPCSGSGTWKRSPYEKWKLTSDDLLDFHKTQINILEGTKDILAENGIIVYVTCSIFAEENEMIIQKFLKDNPSFKVNPIDSLNIPMISTPYGSRILSHKTPGDSFFIAILGS